MADRWMDERDRKWREHRLRQERAERDLGGYGREPRSFALPQGDYDPYDDYDRYDDPRRTEGWQDRDFRGVSPAMRQGEYERQASPRGSYGRQAYDREGWGEAGYGGARPRDHSEAREERESAAFRAGDFLGRAGRRVAEFFSGDHDGETRSFRGLGPKGYRRSDERISEDVHDRLTEDHWLDARDMTVAVASGEVTLSGTVDSRDAKRRAERIAEDVAGVDHVQNNLRVAQREASTAENESWGPEIGANPLQSRPRKN